jgi:hypothetical protein
MSSEEKIRHGKDTALTHGLLHIRRNSNKRTHNAALINLSLRRQTSNVFPQKRSDSGRRNHLDRWSCEPD